MKFTTRFKNVTSKDHAVSKFHRQMFLKLKRISYEIRPNRPISDLGFNLPASLFEGVCPFQECVTQQLGRASYQIHCTLTLYVYMPYEILYY